MTRITRIQTRVSLLVSVAGLIAGLGWPGLSAAAYPPSSSKALHRCYVRQLSAHIGAVKAAAGNDGVKAVFRNTSAHTCEMYGYPGLLRLTKRGHHMNTKVTRGRSMLFRDPGPHRIVVKPGGWGSFGVGFSDVSRNGHICKASHKLEVTPPNDHSHLVAATAPINACAHGSLIVTAVQKGRKPAGP